MESRRDTEPSIKLEEVMRLEREALMSPEQLETRRAIETRIKDNKGPRTSITPYPLIEAAVEDNLTYGDLIELYVEATGQYVRMAELALSSACPELAVGICKKAGREDLAEKLQSHMEGRFFENLPSLEDAINSYKEAGSVHSAYRVLINLGREDEAKAYVSEQLSALMAEAEQRGYFVHAIWAVGVVQPDFQEEFIALAYRTLENKEKFNEGFRLAVKLGDTRQAAVFKEIAGHSK